MNLSRLQIAINLNASQKCCLHCNCFIVNWNWNTAILKWKNKTVKSVVCLDLGYHCRSFFLSCCFFSFFFSKRYAQNIGMSSFHEYCSWHNVFVFNFIFCWWGGIQIEYSVVVFLFSLFSISFFASFTGFLFFFLICLNKNTSTETMKVIEPKAGASIWSDTNFKMKNILLAD